MGVVCVRRANCADIKAHQHAHQLRRVQHDFSAYALAKVFPWVLCFDEKI